MTTNFEYVIPTQYNSAKDLENALCKILEDMPVKVMLSNETPFQVSLELDITQEYTPAANEDITKCVKGMLLDLTSKVNGLNSCLEDLV
jgi:hypothetical protein